MSKKAIPRKNPLPKKGKWIPLKRQTFPNRKAIPSKTAPS
jgi:hypothetical protein